MIRVCLMYKYTLIIQRVQVFYGDGSAAKPGGKLHKQYGKTVYEMF